MQKWRWNTYFKKSSRAGEVVQWVKTLATEPSDLSLNQRTNMMEDGTRELISESYPLQTSATTHGHACWDIHAQIKLCTSNIKMSWFKYFLRRKSWPSVQSCAVYWPLVNHKLYGQWWSNEAENCYQPMLSELLLTWYCTDGLQFGMPTLLC